MYGVLGIIYPLDCTAFVVLGCGNYEVNTSRKEKDIFIVIYELRFGFIILIGQLDSGCADQLSLGYSVPRMEYSVLCTTSSLLHPP